MKFSDGYWLNKPGYEINYACEPYEIHVSDHAIHVVATHDVITSRGQTLDGPVLDITFASTLENTIKVTIEHFRGGMEKTPEFQLYEDDGFFPMTVETDEYAELISGNEAEFANLMNEAAAMYGCTGTHFANASGLHDPNHYTTARDMAKIAQAAMQNDTFRQIAKTFSYTLPSSNVRKERTITGTNENWINPNQATKDDPEGVNSTYYPDAIGIKTGYTAAAGYCYVGAAERDGVELISVLFYTSKSGRWSDSKKLMEYGFSQFVSMTPLELYNENPITVETSGFSLDDADLGRLPLEVRAQASTRTVNIIGTKSDLEAMARNLSQTVLIEYTRDFAAPIEKGEVMGTMTYYPTDGGSPVVYDLIAGRTIQRRDNAPLTLEEIEAEVKADPNPLPPLSVELALVVLTPFAVIFLIIHLIRRALHKTGRHKKSRVPRPRNRYFR